MKFWMGVTDNNWFRFLATKRLDEANFWQPSAKAPFLNAPAGLPFLFKLKRPYNHIAGGGFFVAYSTLPVTLAWEVFGEKNGAASLDEFRGMLEPISSARSHNDEIGCTVLTNPVFFEESDWIADPPGWSGNIVRGKMYDSTENNGSIIWNRIQSLLLPVAGEIRPLIPASESGVREPTGNKYGPPALVKPRLGQSSFRVLVTDAYKRRCAITGENTLVALEAAHIAPYSKEGDHDVKNGLLLRADFHRLFDVGLVSVTPDFRIRVSPRIRETWFNGKIYYRLDNQPLSVLPDRMESRPDPDRLNWHFKTQFQA